jgi:hypothetical protein
MNGIQGYSASKNIEFKEDIYDNIESEEHDNSIEVDY